jgi:hypothetical protein
VLVFDLALFRKLDRLHLAETTNGTFPVLLALIQRTANNQPNNSLNVGKEET